VGFSEVFVPLGASGGVLLGSAVGAAITTVLDHSAVVSWGWRVPFLIGITIGISGVYLRRQMVDDGVAQAGQQRAASPVREAFRTERRTIARLIGLSAVGAVGFYMSFVYVTTYLRQIDHIAQSKALDINTISMIVLLLLLPPVGALSDFFGRKPLLLAATAGTFVLAWPLFWMLHHTDLRMVFLGRSALRS
jgi:MFS transporter, MHS family, proline/betaine transporter